MTSGTDPPIYVCFEVFDDNLEKFREYKTLSETVRDWLNLQFDNLPFVISPLHTPNTGKAHIHGIIELSPFQSVTYDVFSKTFKAFNLPRPELCNNVVSAELYLTHDTPQSRIDDKQRFSVAERQTMIFANGYKLHKQTARDKADDISIVINYVSSNLYDYIKKHIYFDIDDLYSLVSKPDFYSDLDTCLPFDLVVSKGKHEVKSNFRFYLQIGSDIRKKSIEKPLPSEKENFCHFVISNAVMSKDDKLLRSLHYALWCNFSQYRSLMAKNGSSHASYGSNLRMAVNYFKNNDDDMNIVYNIFFEILEKR